MDYTGRSNQTNEKWVPGISIPCLQLSNKIVNFYTSKPFEDVVVNFACSCGSKFAFQAQQDTYTRLIKCNLKFKQ